LKPVDARFSVIPAGRSSCTFEASWGWEEIFRAIGFSTVGEIVDVEGVVELVVDVAFEPFMVSAARDGLPVLVGLVVIVGWVVRVGLAEIIGLADNVGLPLVCGT